MHYIAQQGLRKHLEKQKQEQQRLEFLKQQTNQTTEVASSKITFQTRHQKSMSDALKEVRTNKSTHKDGLHMRPENHKGFY